LLSGVDSKKGSLGVSLSQISKGAGLKLPHLSGEPQIPTIRLHSQVTTVLESFKSLRTFALAASDPVVISQVPLAEVEDQLARFMIWGNNLGAFRPARQESSLDYRLRDAPHLQKTILNILKHLNKSLNEGILP
jgi:hypothetical protein